MEGLSLRTSPEVFESKIMLNQVQVICNSDGTFYAESKLISLIKKVVQFLFRCFFDFTTKYQIGWANGLIHTFNQIEQSKVKLGLDTFRSHLNVARTVTKKLKENINSLTKEALTQLKLRTISCKYRLGGTYSKKYEKAVASEIAIVELYKPLLKVWKQTQVVFPDKELSDQDIQILEDFSRYPKFAKTLLDDSILLERFFKYAFIEKNSNDAFVQFFQIVQKMTDVGLNERISRYGHSAKIKEFQEGDTTYKDLTIRIEGKDQSILNPNEIVVLRNDYKLTVNEIFHVFEKRAYCVGNLEYFGEFEGVTDYGIAVWNPNEWGVWNPAKNDYDRIDLNDPDWIKKMPFADYLTEEEARKLLTDKDGNQIDFKPDEWVFGAVGKNEYAEANLEGSHTMMVVAVPLPDGRRGMAYLGKFTWEFPRDTPGKLKVLVKYLPAAVQFPDENIWRGSRVQGIIAAKASPEAKDQILNKIKATKIGAANKNEFFNILQYNCIDWVFKTLKPVFTDIDPVELVGISFAEADPKGPVGKIVSIWRRFPNLMASVFNCALRILGPNRVIKKKKDLTEKMFEIEYDRMAWKNEGKHKRLHPQGIIALQNRNLKRD